MDHAASTTEQVRSELVRRIGQLQNEGAERRGALAEVEMLRRLAHAHGLFPAVTVAHVLEGALARGDRGPLVSGFLGMLHEAVRCERQDRAACEAFAAACSVRLAG